MYDDTSLIPEEAYCGPLTERLISALMEEEVDLTSDAESSSETIAESLISPTSIAPRSKQQMKEEMYDMEERLKRELAYVGLIDESKVQLAATENDEITRELRLLQNDLRRVARLNNERKSVLYERAVDEMAYQEYTHLVDEVNKLVDQSYQKRSKLIKKKKKAANGIFFKPPPDGVLALLDRRRRLLQELEPIFPPSTQRLAPTTTVFGDEPPWAHASNLAHIMDRPVAPKEVIASGPASRVVTPPLGNQPTDQASSVGFNGPTAADATSKMTGDAPTIVLDAAAAIAAGAKTKSGKPKAPRKPSIKKSAKAAKTLPTVPEAEVADAAGAAATAAPDTPGSPDTKKPRKPRQPRKKKEEQKPEEDAMDALAEGSTSMVPDWMKGAFFG